MPLSADQQAMLQLVLERGQSYADLASVLEVEEAQVRTRARAALTELGGADPDRHVGLTDYLLGQADPIGRADAVRHLKDDPDDLALATDLAQRLREIAPEAELPRLPGEERQPRPRRAPRLPLVRLPIPARLRRRPATEQGPGSASSAEAVARRGPLTTLSRRQTQLLVGLGSGAVLLAAIILGAAGAFSGDGSNEGTTTTATNPNAGSELARVKLEPQSGGGGSGTAIFGLASASQPYVDVTLGGLEPAPQGQTYVIWLLLTPNQGYPLAPVGSCSSTVPPPCLQDGSYHDRVEIQSPLLAVVSRVQLVDVSIAPVDTITKAIKSAFDKQHIVLKRPGTSVLRGAIPTSGGGAG